MRLMRVGEPGSEVPAVLDAHDCYRDLSEVTRDFTPEWLASGGIAALEHLDVDVLRTLPKDQRIGAPISRVGKIVCVGLNYSDHAAETGQELPREPILFLKGGHTVQGPNDAVVLPKGSKKSDWEVELGVIMGRRALYVSEKSALDYVAGYCVCNDLSEREYQLERCGQWDKGKNCDTFGPLGPALVTRDEIADTQNLRLWLDVNEKRYQNGSTATMVFTVPFLIHYISQFMPLEPGDVISTGTPPGVGLGQKPPVYLRSGDVIRLGIEGIGEQKQHVLAYEQGIR